MSEVSPAQVKVDLDDVSENGSTADNKDTGMNDGVETNQQKAKKKKIYFRSDFVGDGSSDEDSDDSDEERKPKEKSSSITQCNPVS